MEQNFQAAVETGEIPGVVLLATDASERFHYGNAIGNSSLKPGSERLFKLDATLSIASCSKIITTIAALQCIERGQFGLDDDVSTILVELQDLKIITGFDESTGNATFVPAENKITLRHLLTHTSGIAYDFINPVINRWRTSVGRTPDITSTEPILKRIALPLVFEPGEGFEYGYSMDWAGTLVSRLNNISLDEYVQKYIAQPLGIDDMTFHLENNDQVRSKLADFNLRDGGMNEYGTTANPNGAISWMPGHLWVDPVVDEYGGWGIYTSGPSFLKVLASILRDDGKLLRSETIDHMFQNQLSSASKDMLKRTLSVPEINNYLGGSPLGLEKGWGLGGLLMLEDSASTGQNAGTMQWAGLPNLFWWIDRKAALCGLYASQLVPTGDPRSVEWSTTFMKEMYIRLEESRSRA
ncbi:beta-lactamase/transpeptidase-like protein [Aspergillus steynii IBT 23096]|uniref:Beta-lactamase/transpeptidase-like protein n=1 Tax=Aspergillus steynii IBT 23096 TaxID=1392250 RepID=A0A2I2G6J5_9EURO|nr:beta-lactamase/transpeptidase-like protein [Aspergillus steynii IBT 23096]PLB48495.1 beta-lactamase/transpeptidase-like protein [Aspergillus steynii IBT 23096]